MRRLRRLRAGSRRGAPRLFRPLRAPAPRPGVRGHRHGRAGRPHDDPARHRASSPRSSTSRSSARSSGDMAIGHVRYSTTGSAAWENSQPIYRVGPPRARPGPQRQPDQRGRAACRAARRGRRLPLHLGLGDHRRAAGQPRGRHDRGRGVRRAAAAAGRVLHRRHDPRGRRRLPRPARPAPAGAGDAPHPDGPPTASWPRSRAPSTSSAPRFLREVEPGEVVTLTDDGPADAPGRRGRAPRLLRLRAHLLRPARLAPGGQPHPGLPAQDGGDPVARGAHRRRRGHPRARLGQPGRARASPARRGSRRTTG